MDFIKEFKKLTHKNIVNSIPTWEEIQDTDKLRRLRIIFLNKRMERIENVLSEIGLEYKSLPCYQRNISSFSKEEKEIYEGRLNLFIVNHKLYNMRKAFRTSVNFETFDYRIKWGGNKNQLIIFYKELLLNKIISNNATLKMFATNFSFNNNKTKKSSESNPIQIITTLSIMDMIIKQLMNKTVSKGNKKKYIDDNTIWKKFNHIFIDRNGNSLINHLPNFNKINLPKTTQKTVDQIVKRVTKHSSHSI